MLKIHYHILIYIRICPVFDMPVFVNLPFFARFVSDELNPGTNLTMLNLDWCSFLWNKIDVYPIGKCLSLRRYKYDTKIVKSLRETLILGQLCGNFRDSRGTGVILILNYYNFRASRKICSFLKFLYIRKATDWKIRKI